MTESDHCPFLGLPTELRLLIYDFALLDAQVITIGSAELVGARPDIVHRLYGNNSSPQPGLLQNHEPVIENSYNPRLLSITTPPTISLNPTTSNPTNTTNGIHSTHTALLLTNKQIHSELAHHFSTAQNRKTSLFASYPHGLHVLSTTTPGLLRQARSIHLAGAYTPQTFDPSRAARLGYSGAHVSNEGAKYHGGSVPDYGSQLGQLIAGLFGPNARTSVQKLEMRIHYPGTDSYSTVWGDDNSPTVVALRNIFAGEVTIEVWRGRWGTGCYLFVVPNRDGGVGGDGRGKRLVSTVWRRLEEGRRGERDCGSWVVDPKWPEWEDRGGVVEGEGCVVSSVHAATNSGS